MKKSIFLSVLIISFIATYAQSYSNEEKGQEEYQIKKVSYHFTFDVAPLFLGVQIDLNDKEYYLDIFRFGCYQSHHLLLNEKIAVGLGFGVELGVLNSDIDFPIFVNFRYYFRNPNPQKKLIQPFGNFGFGTTLNNVIEQSGNSIIFEAPGIFVNISGGIKVRRFQFHAGFHLRTEKNLNHKSQLWSPLRKGIVIDFAARVGFCL
ncbi:MAG: hypothetical protein FWC34_07025 [Bacteroidetes bacterium]|nr:hypothetical protein [Bacteroidota bacterium]MCL2302655.1 hypothetical protein [Lentimicrobiaceae bacterium]